MGESGAEGFVKAFGERGKRTAKINGEIMTCIFTEWMKKEGIPRQILTPWKGLGCLTGLGG